MEQNTKDNLEQIFKKYYSAHREGKLSEAEKGYKEILKIKTDWGLALNALGNLYLDQDRPEKAIEIQPDYLSPHLNLGLVLQKTEQFKEAEGHYNKVLKIQPDNEIAKFMLQSIGGDEIPDAAPVEHVRSIFDQCAENFETLLVQGLKYKTPEFLFNLVRPYLTEKMSILDLGCGTGLGAQLYQPFAKSLTGVDVSAKMLKKASEKKLYNRLEVFDILQDWVFPTKFDLIYSSDVFVYFGNLDIIIKSASSYLVNGGKIAFSVEELDNTANYQLHPSGRYAHSQKYIQACLNRHELKIIEINKTDIRNQSGNPVRGLLIVAIKK